jgi:hypothetical protein
MDLRLDHLYRETHHWEDSVAWWTNLGFRFTNQWGDEPHRAGTLVNAGTEVVLAEVPADTEPSSTTFLATDDIDGFAGRLGTTVEDTHWGTHMVTAVDPDGRTYNIEREAPE